MFEVGETYLDRAGEFWYLCTGIRNNDVLLEKYTIVEGRPTKKLHTVMVHKELCTQLVPAAMSVHDAEKLHAKREIEHLNLKIGIVEEELKELVKQRNRYQKLLDKEEPCKPSIAIQKLNQTSTKSKQKEATSGSATKR
jgi:hypothetical protein